MSAHKPRVADLGPFHASVRAHKRALLVAALRENLGNRTWAAQSLGLSRTYFLTLLRRYEITR